MKSERRHELEQNELADWLTDGIETVKPYTNLILGTILLIVILVVGGVWWVQQSVIESAEAWDSYYVAMSSRNPDSLEMVADDYPSSKAACWAQTVAADLHLNAGCNQLFSNRADANLELDKAAELFEQVLDKSRESVLLNRATFGLAQTREAMGDLDEAKPLYEKVAKTWPDGPFAKSATQRLKALEQPSTLAFYDRFEKFDPKPAFADEPGIPGAGPLFDDSSLISPNSAVDPGAFPNLDLETLKNELPIDLEEEAETPQEDAGEKNADTPQPAEEKADPGENK